MEFLYEEGKLNLLDEFEKLKDIMDFSNLDPEDTRYNFCYRGRICYSYLL